MSMGKEDLIKQIMSKNSTIQIEWIKDKDGNYDYPLLIVPKGLMPQVDDEIRNNGYFTAEKGSWKKDDNYLVISIVSVVEKKID